MYLSLDKQGVEGKVWQMCTENVMYPTYSTIDIISDRDIICY